MIIPASRAQAAGRPAVAFPGGVIIPDWGVVATPQAQNALRAIVEAFIGPKWDGLDETESGIHGIVLSSYASSGRAPATADVAAAAGLTMDEADGVLRRLAMRDLLVLDSGGRISGAYPFTDGQTEHHVEADGFAVGAMCAIDALGIGAMLERDVAVRSACRHCRRPVAIRTLGHGRELDQVEPSGIVVWSGRRYAAGCAASSLCTVQAFFCDDAHLEAWRTNSPPAGQEGVRLSPAEALEVGVAIFAPMRMEWPSWIPTT
ncbi:alkylmercury lyase family protein [Caulobacter sp.]|uniref:alkylmercury lyase family protein n=1 Tax=Caulobacter sp. TaxID=78 RepID=UPI0025C179FB|nr:alkylmercury lyase family protein [Caulobacter sp.]MBQ1561293.1 alkylmercury lyase family protein [Caulobacter sp.]